MTLGTRSRSVREYGGQPGRDCPEWAAAYRGTPTPNPAMKAAVGSGVGSDVSSGNGRVWTSSRQCLGHGCVRQEDTVGIRVTPDRMGIGKTALWCQGD